MSKFVILFAVFALVGCANQTEHGSLYATIYNEDCEDIKSVKVFQTLNDGALASVCDNSYSDICIGATVFIPKSLDKVMWDDKKITPPKGKCFVFNDVYKYTSKDERNRTVPIADFAYQYSPKSEEEAIERLKETHQEAYNSCMEEMAKDKKIKAEDRTTKCTCLVDTIFEMMLMSGGDTDTVSTKIGSEVTKKCGPFPKSFGI